jgi:hypothetical protein
VEADSDSGKKNSKRVLPQPIHDSDSAIMHVRLDVRLIQISFYERIAMTSEGIDPGDDICKQSGQSDTLNCYTKRDITEQLMCSATRLYKVSD